MDDDVLEFALFVFIEVLLGSLPLLEVAVEASIQEVSHDTTSRLDLLAFPYLRQAIDLLVVLSKVGIHVFLEGVAHQLAGSLLLVELQSVEANLQFVVPDPLQKLNSVDILPGKLPTLSYVVLPGLDTLPESGLPQDPGLLAAFSQSKEDGLVVTLG